MNNLKVGLQSLFNAVTLCKTVNTVPVYRAKSEFLCLIWKQIAVTNSGNFKHQKSLLMKTYGCSHHSGSNLGLSVYANTLAAALKHAAM